MSSDATLSPVPETRGARDSLSAADKMGALVAVTSGAYREAVIAFSEYTGQFYIDAGTEISDGFILSGGADHEPTPEAAIHAYWDRITRIPIGHEVVVTKPGDVQWRGRWNGFMWKESAKTPDSAESERVTSSPQPVNSDMGEK